MPTRSTSLFWTILLSVAGLCSGALFYVLRKIFGDFVGSWVAETIGAWTGIEEARVKAIVAGWLPAVAIIAFAMWVTFVVTRWRYAADQKPALGTIPVASSTGRVFVPTNISLQELVKPFSNYTNLDASGLVARYIGRWIIVKGTVQDIVSIKSNHVILTYKVDFFDGPTVFMHFTEIFAAQALMLTKGMSFVATGRIDDIQPSRVVLNGCEFEISSQYLSGVS